MVCHRGVDGSPGQRHRLSLIHRQSHIEVWLSPIDKLVPRGGRHTVIVGIGALLVPRKYELFLVNRSGRLEVLPSDLELIYGMLIVCLEKFGPSHAQMSM